MMERRKEKLNDDDGRGTNERLVYGKENRWTNYLYLLATFLLHDL